MFAMHSLPLDLDFNSGFGNVIPHNGAAHMGTYGIKHIRLSERNAPSRLAVGYVCLIRWYLAFVEAANVFVQSHFQQKEIE